MKNEFLKFPARPASYLPKISSRRMGLQNFRNVAYKSDGSGGADDAEAEALLARVKAEVSTELNTRGYAKADDVAAKITEQLKGLNVEALRNFDATKISGTVANLAAEVEKLQNRAVGAPGAGAMNALKAMLADKEVMGRIERSFDPYSNSSVTLNVRAALPVITTTAGAGGIDDTLVPADILSSFSVDAFVKRRYPNEFIFDLATRNTVAKITEYKTWLEEGTEDGAFAIVAQGAVKPLVSKTLVRNVSKYQKVAGKRVYTEEFAKFRQEAYQILETLFNDQLLRNYAALLVANLNTKAASYVGTALDAQYAAPTDYHAIAAVAAQIESLDFFPDTLFLNPQDKWRIGMEQNSQGSFYVAIPQYSPDGTVSMMGFRVVTSNRVPVGSAYLGEARLYKIEDEAVSVRLGYGINVTVGTIGTSGAQGVIAVDSDVDTNRFRIIAETFFHNYIASNHTGSFVKFNFAAVKTALLKP